MNVRISEPKKLKSKHSDANTFSFDIFDTFLVRNCTTPEGVFHLAFELSPAFETFPAAVDAYVQHRRQAEIRARKAALQQTGSLEVTIEEIYERFPLRLFALKRASLPDLVRAEFDAELELCRANPKILQQYLEIRATGARTGFISDTYWSKAQLAELLRSCHPGLQWDFLYSSSDSRTNKSERLFAVYLAEQTLAPSRAVHIGDNPKADIEGARRHGIAATHYPQATPALASIFNREAVVGALLCRDKATTLDRGLRTLRRIIASEQPESPPTFGLGVSVLGPVMRAFDAFVDNRVRRIDRGGDATVVAFLGRDGFLSHQVWKQMRDSDACYLEINRRVGVMGSSDTPEPLIELLGNLTAIDSGAFLDLVGTLPRPVSDFFSRSPRGIATGRDLAEALGGLIDKDDVAAISADIRTELLAYLRRQIPNFDGCRDLVLVDLGYSGSIQQALRRIFDIEGIDIRLHGLYLLSVDDAFNSLSGGDTYEGFISDLVVTPHAKRMLTRNVALLEQMCCSTEGTVRSYRQGVVQRENSSRSAVGRAFTEEVQAGALAFVTALRDHAPVHSEAPFADLDIAARSTIAILGRLLLLPTDDELSRLGPLQHDINMGTATLAPLVDVDFAATLQVTHSFPDLCAAPGPPMWLAGSLATLSPTHNFLYLLSGSNLLPSDMFGDASCGRIDIGLFGTDGSSGLVQVEWYRTGIGDLRLRIPIARRMAVRTIVVPIARLASEGLIAGPFLQTGASIEKALLQTGALKFAPEHVTTAGLVRSGRYFCATEEDGALVIEMPSQTAPVAIVSVGLTSLKQQRVMAS
jgi:FMN phosphatase YigB (HAD superfamily)